MDKDLLNWFLSRFTDGLNGFEVIVLLGGAISMIAGIVKIVDGYSRAQGWFTFIMGMCYSLLFFISGNGLATGDSLAICVAITVILNILSWICVYNFKAKDVFIWLQGYFLFIIVAFFAGILDEMLSLPDLVVWQFAILITSLLVEVVVAIAMNDNIRTHKGADDDDITDDTNIVDITWMSD